MIDARSCTFISPISHSVYFLIAAQIAKANAILNGLGNFGNLGSNEEIQLKHALQTLRFHKLLQQVAHQIA